MQNILMSSVAFILFALISLNIAHADKHDVHKDDIVQGNIICLFPDKDSGSVAPVIATSPCDGKPTHAHVIVDTRGEVGQVYAVEGTDEAITRLEKKSKRKGVDVKGKISGSQKAWIITVD